MGEPGNGKKNTSEKKKPEKEGLLKGGPKEELLSGMEKDELLEGMQKEELLEGEKEELLEGANEEKLLMDEKETKLVELTESLQRVAAEFDNYKKRVAKERGEQEENGRVKMVEKLLPFLDELELASIAAEKAGDGEIRSGMKLLYSKFKSMLGKEGLQEMNPLGKKFDPYRHEAAMHEEKEGAQEGEIVSVIRKGYMLNGKILRHAMVSVCRKNSENAGEEKKDG